MGSGQALQAASGVGSFLLKTAVEWCACLLLVRIASSARDRFNIWLAMLVAFVAQWVWMWAAILRPVAVAPEPAASVAAHGRLIAVGAGTTHMLVQGMTILLVGYLAVVAWRLLGTLAAWVRLSRALRHKLTAGERVEAIFREVAKGTAAEAWGCELWVLPGLSSPATLGWRRPLVIVPPSCETQDRAELKAAFWHELKHVERRDALWNGLARICRDVLWFHPCVHHGVTRMSAERELACDAAVVREHPHSRDVYATCLVRFARMRDLAPQPVIASIEMASGDALLTTRVRSILNDLPGAGGLSRVLRGAAIAATIGLMAAMVPGMNVLFGAERVGGAVVSLGSPEPPRTAKRHAERAAGGVIKQVEAPAGGVEQTQAEAAMPIMHDEALAAEHRAGMGVLMESSGMDGPPTEDGRAAVSGGTERPAAGQKPTAWGSVAVDAAERIALASGGHDGDDHH
jgi:beta-lactamase regulating signal transducer with metallopeptidase domain